MKLLVTRGGHFSYIKIIIINAIMNKKKLNKKY